MCSYSHSLSLSSPSRCSLVVGCVGLFVLFLVVGWGWSVCACDCLFVVVAAAVLFICFSLPCNWLFYLCDFLSLLARRVPVRCLIRWPSFDIPRVCTTRDLLTFWFVFQNHSHSYHPLDSAPSLFHPPLPTTTIFNFSHPEPFVCISPCYRLCPCPSICFLSVRFVFYVGSITCMVIPRICFSCRSALQVLCGGHTDRHCAGSLTPGPHCLALFCCLFSF